MPILILIDVQYSESCSSFEKGLNGQNYSSWDSHHLVKNFPPDKFLIPPTGPLTPYYYLENPVLYIKLQKR